MGSDSNWVDNSDLIAVYTKSQQDYPDGIGIRHSHFVKTCIVGKKMLIDCDRYELNQLVKALRKHYYIYQHKLKQKNPS